MGADDLTQRPDSGADEAVAEDWWQASDGRWYPPEAHQGVQRETAPGPDWWKASDGRWYPPDASVESPEPAEAGSDDHWWSRKPRAERRPLLSSRLLWNVWEFKHPGKVVIAAFVGVFGLIFVITTVVALVAVIGGDDGDERAGEVTVGDEVVVESSLEGTLTGKVDVSFPLAGGAVTVNSAQVELDDGRFVDAAVPTSLHDSLGKGVEVLVVETPGGEYEWRITELVGGLEATVEAPAEESAVEGAVEDEGQEPVVLGILGEEPYGYDGDDGITGIGPDVVGSVLAALDIPVEAWTVGDPDMLEVNLLVGDIDVIASGVLVISDLVNDQVLLSNPDRCMGEILLVPAGNPLGLSDLTSIAASGATVGFIEEDPFYPAWMDAAGIADDQVMSFPFMDLQIHYEMLVAGDIDAIVILSSVPLWGEFAPDQTDPSIESTAPFYPTNAAGEEELARCFGYGFVDEDLRDAFNEELARQHASGTIGDIHEEHGFPRVEADKAAGVTLDDLIEP